MYDSMGPWSEDTNTRTTTDACVHACTHAMHRSSLGDDERVFVRSFVRSLARASFGARGRATTLDRRIDLERGERTINRTTRVESNRITLQYITSNR